LLKILEVLKKISSAAGQILVSKSTTLLTNY
jgi:hypothetical protein